jgi:hypothetical protein
VKRAPFTKTLLQKVAGGNLRENHFKHFEMILSRLSNPGPPWAESGLYEAHTSAGSEWYDPGEVHCNSLEAGPSSWYQELISVPFWYHIWYVLHCPPVPLASCGSPIFFIFLILIDFRSFYRVKVPKLSPSLQSVVCTVVSLPSSSENWTQDAFTSFGTLTSPLTSIPPDRTIPVLYILVAQKRKACLCLWMPS